MSYNKNLSMKRAMEVYEEVKNEKFVRGKEIEVIGYVYGDGTKEGMKNRRGVDMILEK